VALTKGTRVRWRAHQSMAFDHSGARKLASGGTTERGENGELGSGLTGARAAARWPGDGGKWWWWLVLGEVGVADSGASKGGRGECGDGRGAPRPFIGARRRGAAEGGGETVGGNGLNTIEGQPGMERSEGGTR
jgi:hypothetical protein